MNILISGKSTGRLASKIYKALTNHSILFCTDIFDYSQFKKLNNIDIFIAAAWNMKSNYKEDPINEYYAKVTIDWLREAKRRNVKSIYLGTSDKSSFDSNCLYHICKNKCDKYADVTLKIPFVWQPNRINSLAYKVANKLDYSLVDGKFIYVTEMQIIDKIINIIDSKIDKQIVEFDIEPQPLEYWVENLNIG